jgi:hypothetical protein
VRGRRRRLALGALDQAERQRRSESRAAYGEAGTLQELAPVERFGKRRRRGKPGHPLQEHG